MIPLIITVHCFAPGEWRSNTDLHVSRGQQGTGSPMISTVGLISLSASPHPVSPGAPAPKPTENTEIYYLLHFVFNLPAVADFYPPFLIVYFVTHAAKIISQTNVASWIITTKNEKLPRLRIKFKLTLLLSASGNGRFRIIYCLCKASSRVRIFDLSFFLFLLCFGLLQPCSKWSEKANK